MSKTKRQTELTARTIMPTSGAYWKDGVLTIDDIPSKEIVQHALNKGWIKKPAEIISSNKR